MENKLYMIGFPWINGSTRNWLISDLIQRDNVVIIKNIWAGEGKNKVLQQLYKGYQERKERIIFKWTRKLFYRCKVFQDIFYSQFALSQMNFEDDKCNILVLCNSGLCMGYTHQYLEWIKRRIPNAYFILYQVDPTDIFYQQIYKDRTVLNLFDKIYNINYSDSNRLGHHYWPLVYSEGDINSQYQLYFCGQSSDRDRVLLEIYKECVQREVKAKLIRWHTDKKQYEGITCIEEPISYEENLLYVFRSNCILELMHENYDNMTQRYSEAVIYNKKLLTNNRKIESFPYYNPKWMRIFFCVDDIDWEWVMAKEDVDYKYCGDFSPLELVDDICNTRGKRTCNKKNVEY